MALPTVCRASYDRLMETTVDLARFQRKAQALLVLRERLYHHPTRYPKTHKRLQRMWNEASPSYQRRVGRRELELMQLCAELERVLELEPVVSVLLRVDTPHKA